MRSWWILLIGSLMALTLYACDKTPAADTCPVIDAGPPPVCPDGCKWDGKECRKTGGVIWDGLRDGGGPPKPTPSQ